MPKVYLLGEPKVILGKKDYRFVANRRSQLLAYLAHRHERVTRDHLADMFWSHTDSQAARRNLRKVLFEAKNLEWSAGFEQDEQGASWLIETDVAVFEEGIKHKQWAKAIEVYAGPFLKGLESEDGTEFEIWLEQERQRLEELYQSASEHYADDLEQQGHIDKALDFLRKTLEHEPLNESLHRHIIRLEYERGNSEAAFEQFERCREVLQKELGVEPLEETINLLKMLEQGSDTQGKFAHLLRKPEAVPEAPPTLFGRDKLLKEILSLLKKGERVLAQGFGGMGKTALAATVAKTMLQQNKKPVLWLQVGTENPDAIFEALARPFEAQQDLAQAEDKAAYLKNVLQKQALSLLVLDDVWNAYTLSKVVEALPKELPFLVTSRQRYPRLTRVYVDRLERPASVELLKHHAHVYSVPRPPGPSADLAEERLETLCELLGDHAFAIRLAGLALRETTPEALYERIKNAPHDLKIPGELREVGRESVASLLNVSLETLDDRAYETFLSYGILESPSASAGFLAQCLDREVSQIEDALFDLVQRGLAERVSKPGSDLVSYRLHDLAHSYAKANRFQRPSTLRRSAMSFLKNHRDAVDILDLDISNILTATQSASENGEDNDFIDFMYLLTVEGNYYKGRGHNRRSVEFLKTAIDKAKQHNLLEKAHHLLSRLGSYYYDYLKNYDLAFHSFDEARVLAKELGNLRREAVLSGLVAYARFHQGKKDVDEYMARAYEIAQMTNDDECLCTVLDQLGYISGSRGDMKASNKYLYESLEVLARLESNQKITQKVIDSNRFFLLLNLGETEYHLGDFKKGVQLREQALEIARQQGNQIWMAYAHHELGEMYHQAGYREEAQTNMLQALKLFEQNNATKDVEATLSFLKDGGYDSAA